MDKTLPCSLRIHSRVELCPSRGRSVRNSSSFPNTLGEQVKHLPPGASPFHYSLNYIQPLVISATILYNKVFPDEVLTYNSSLMTFLHIFPSSFTLSQLFCFPSLLLIFHLLFSFIPYLSLHLPSFKAHVNNLLDFYSSDLLTSFSSGFFFFSPLLYSE